MAAAHSDIQDDNPAKHNPRIYGDLISISVYSSRVLLNQDHRCRYQLLPVEPRPPSSVSFSDCWRVSELGSMAPLILDGIMKTTRELARSMSYHEFSHPANEVLAVVLAGILGGFAFGVLHFSFENVWFRLLSLLEARGAISRLAPSIAVTRVYPSKEDFFSVAIAPMPLAAVMYASRRFYYDHAHFSFDLAGGITFTWILMLVHDAYFWFVHSCMHYFKRAYRLLHQLHHSTSGDITVFSTAHGEILDVTVSITPFYLLVLLLLYLEGNWNPFHIILATFAVNNVNMMGHSGFRLPAFVYVPASLGVLLIPLAQRPIHHYIHHLDPRFNRSLYFTWCDRLAGTYRGTHPKCTSPNEP